SLPSSWPSPSSLQGGEDNGKQGEKKDEEEAERQLREMIKTLDLAIILAGGAGQKRGRGWIDSALELLEEVWDERPRCSSQSKKLSGVSSSSDADESDIDDDERQPKRPRTDSDSDAPSRPAANNPNPWENTP